MRVYKIIDLFAGAGGLSQGFLQEGHFEVVMAVEKNKEARETYRINHPNTHIEEDVTELDYEKIRKTYPLIDVIIGGPPCQGFSNANRQKNTAISGNNVLVKAYVKSVVELSPRVFVMENVAMLQSAKHKFFVTKADRSMLGKLGIEGKEEPLVLLPENITLPCAQDIIESQDLRNTLLWDEHTYYALNTLYKIGSATVSKVKKRINNKRSILEHFVTNVENSVDGLQPIFEWNKIAANEINRWLFGQQEDVSIRTLKNALYNVIHFQRMLQKINELSANDVEVTRHEAREGVTVYLLAYPVLEYIQKQLGSKYKIEKGVLNAANYGVPQYRQRYVVYGVRNDIRAFPQMPKVEDDFILHPRTVRDAIEDLEGIEPYSDMEAGKAGHTIASTYVGKELAELRDLKSSDVLYNHINTQTTETAMMRFESLLPGQNFHNLTADMKTTYSDASRTQNTIYLRLSYDKPSGTVINVRKSMWVHPIKNRALSIREAARLQTFPDSFRFVGSKNSQYQQVGNAVPPILAKAIAREVRRVLDSQFHGIQNGKPNT